MELQEPTTRKRLTRREVVEKLLAGAAAGSAWPLFASTHPIHAVAKFSAIFEQAATAQKSDHWTPQFLNQHQNETLIALAERVVPGSTRARVNQFIDLLLSIDTKENQGMFSVALAVIDKESSKRFEHPFLELKADQQDVLLTAISASTIDSEPFSRLKEWISLAYYSSEDGMRELGWTENRAFRSFPGCQQSNPS